MHFRSPGTNRDLGRSDQEGEAQSLDEPTLAQPFMDMASSSHEGQILGENFSMDGFGMPKEGVLQTGVSHLKKVTKTGGKKGHI